MSDLTQSSSDSNESNASNTVDKHQSARQARLLSMRTSQKRLKLKRQRDIDLLKDEVKKLKAENEHYRLQNESLLNDYGEILSILDLNGITLAQFVKLSNLNQDALDTVHININDDKQYILLQDFCQKYNRTKYPYLYINDVFILKDLCDRYCHCSAKHTRYSKLNPVFQNSYKYISIYGLSLPNTYIEQNIAVYKYHKIPKQWISPIHIPSGSIGIMAVLEIVAQRFNPDTMIMEVFLGFLLRYSYATIYGPVIFPQELEICFDLCQNAKFDEAYVLGTLDNQLCAYDYLMLAKEKLATSMI